MKSAALLALAAAAAVNAGPTTTLRSQPRATELEPITVTGNAFFKGKDRFYVRGVDYQPGGASGNVDPLADTKVCMPDIVKFKKLGVNVIRVYSTDNTLDHDECMNALADAGIYVVLDANNPKYSINREHPAPSYNAVYLQSVFATIDAFAKYSNTMAFFSGNEVIHDLKNTTLAARYVKATDRDMRAYIKARKYRKMLVGYSAADVTTNRMQTAAYFNCGAEDERSDFFAFVRLPGLCPPAYCNANHTPNRTTTRGAAATSSPPAGTPRSAPSLATVSPFSCPSTAATPTSGTLARSSRSCTAT